MSRRSSQFLIACALSSHLMGLGCAKQNQTPMSNSSTSSATPDSTGSAAAVASIWNYPTTRVTDAGDTIHGVFVADPYRWLEDAASSEVQAWMREQDAFGRELLRKLPTRDAFAKRLTELFYFDAVSAPTHRKGRYFLTRKHAKLEKPIVYWKQGASGEEQVLFDPNGWSKDGSVGLHGWTPSEDGKLVAYQVSENNSDETVTYVVEVASGRKLPDVIAGTKYADISWTPDGKGFYYTWVPQVGGNVTVANRPGFAELRYHALGHDPAKDLIVRAATGNAETFIGGYVSRDGKWLFAVVQHGWNSTDVYFRDAHKPKAAWTTLVEGMDATYSVYPWQGAFYIFTNEGAPRYRVFKTTPAKAARDQWQEIVPQSDATLEGMSIVGNHLALAYLRSAANDLELRDLKGALVRKISLPGIGTTNGVVGNPDEDEAFFDFTSFTQPSMIYKTSIKAGTTAEWARVTLPVDLSNVVSEQVTYKSKDGTPVTMFLIHRKDLVRNGRTPTILYGYGGFNVSLTPGFSGTRAAWLEQGGMYAIPNLRGGGEYGEDWHKAGMLLQKQNVFDDFVWAAKYLIDNKYTSPQHLGIQGGSNGGLLVGATMVQAPELFAAVVCSVPLLDMVRFHLFGSGRTWVPEYGSAEDPAQFKAILAYSPYNNVKKGAKYPALLMDAADSDDRVDPMHARKFIAAIQAASASDAPAVMRIESNAGHGGADMVKAQVDRSADVLAFFWSELNGK